MIDSEDYTDWDWLPGAASEIEDYLARLLTEGAINAHDVTARRKSIRSYQEKCQRKGYVDPRRKMTDCVAARVITYSVTDRDKVCDLIRDCFALGEDKEPGALKPERLRGYDCVHLVATGEKEGAPSGWLINGGNLARYFERFGGLEIQARTVAAHAWAEFEHHIRYKGAGYLAIGDRDQEVIDNLFGAASDARRALDEVFVAIESILANPAGSLAAHGVVSDPAHEEIAQISQSEQTPISVGSLGDLLKFRFPDDEEGTEAGLDFACQIAAASGLDSIEALSDALDRVDGDQVRSLMGISTHVTRVRRLDDALLAAFGEKYIDDTGAIGSGRWVDSRAEKLRWRYDRLRMKVNVYEITGSDCPPSVRSVPMSAARAVREVARILAACLGGDAACVKDVISQSNDLSPSDRAREVGYGDGQSIWVATNLSRERSDQTLRTLLGEYDTVRLQVRKSGVNMLPEPEDALDSF